MKLFWKPHLKMASHLKGVVKSTMTIKYMKRYESTKDIIASKRFTVVAISRLFDITRKVRYELQNFNKKKKHKNIILH